jgi:D-xylose transport system permease protein
VTTTTTATSAGIEVVKPTVRTHAQDYVRRLRGGDLGSLPAVLGLIVLCLIFSIARPVFFSEANFANLFVQGAAVIAIAMGLVFVLLLGEIDLSAGFTAGVCAAVLAIISTDWGWPWYLAILGACLTGAVIGIVLGLLVAKVRIPSFVVTLAAFLAFQGVLLLLIKGGTNKTVSDPVIIAIESSNLAPWLGWLLALVAVAGYAAVQLLRVRGRAARGLVTDPMGVVAWRIVALAVLLLFPVLVLNQERSINPVVVSVKGVPWVVPILGVILVLGTFLLARTIYGRRVYAVGGNAEAARRAGIGVDWIRISVFVFGSFLASVGGIILASRGRSVDPSTGGNTVLLYAVGAAVIGGTSLFGGRGRLIDAVIGGAVIAVIDNGMGLLGYSSGTKFILTGLILLAAATVDALSRRRAAATGTT